MAVKVTRRHLAALAALPLAETPPSAQGQASTEDDLAIQRENLKRWREQMAKLKLPIATEPATVFKA
jgi:hypothetical protein